MRWLLMAMDHVGSQMLGRGFRFAVIGPFRRRFDAHFPILLQSGRPPSRRWFAPSLPVPQQLPLSRQRSNPGAGRPAKVGRQHYFGEKEPLLPGWLPPPNALFGLPWRLAAHHAVNVGMELYRHPPGMEDDGEADFAF